MTERDVDQLIQAAQMFDETAQSIDRQQYPTYRRMAFLARVWARYKLNNDS